MRYRCVMDFKFLYYGEKDFLLDLLDYYFRCHRVSDSSADEFAVWLCEVFAGDFDGCCRAAADKEPAAGLCL